MLVSAPQSALIYDQIPQNRRKTVLLVVCALAIVMAFIFSVSYGIAEVVTSSFGFFGFATEVGHSLDKSDTPVFQGEPGDWAEQMATRREDVQFQIWRRHQERRKLEEAG